jgi:lipopolysaccharide transport system permease protein
MNFEPTDTLVVEPPAPVASSAPRRPFLTIKADKGWVPLDLSELWQFRDLMFALAGRDIKLRYKQTALGVVWVVLQPLMAAGIMTFVFGTIAHLDSGPVPFFVFSYAGLMFWGLFNAVLTKAGGSLVGNSNLISKVFFPRLILPLSSLPSAMLDFCIAVGMLAALMVMNHVVPSARLSVGSTTLFPGSGLLLLPIWIVLLLCFAIGIGLVTTSLMVSYRDVGYMLPLALQILFYACPIVYQVSKVPTKALFWYNINPLSSIFEAITWSIFGIEALEWARLAYAAVAAVVVLLGGVYAFKRMEKKFADVI